MNVDRTAPAGIFHVVTAVWGREFLDLFLNWSIPNQMGEGNVPALPPGSRYRIMTRAADVDEVRHHPMVHALERAIPVDIEAVPAFESPCLPDVRCGDRRFELVTECNRLAIRDAARVGAALLFPSPDHVLSSNTFAAIMRRHQEGYRAVVCTGLRLEKEAFLHALTNAGGSRGPRPPRELVRIALPHLHAHTRRMFADAREFLTYPLGVYWEVGRTGLLGRSFHFHPLMVDPMQPLALPRLTIDGGYLPYACPDLRRVHVVTDSDEFVVFELSDATQGAGCSSGADVALRRATSMAARCDRFGIAYWRRYPVRIHAEDLGDEWRVAGRTAETFVRAVMWRSWPFGVRSKRWYRWVGHTHGCLDPYRRTWRSRTSRLRKRVLRSVRLASSRASKVRRRMTRRFFHRIGVSLQ